MEEKSIGESVTDVISAPGEWGKLTTLFFVMLIVSLAVVVAIGYFIRRKSPKDPPTDILKPL